jgi:hypothetical protein
MIIRLCTEDKNYEAVRTLCTESFPCFTIYRSEGCWNGIVEPALTIEIAVIPHEPDTLAQYKTMACELALSIKEVNQQEAVLIEYIDSTNVLI